MTRGVRAPYILFEGDSVHAPHHHYGVGNEAMAYLTFIAQYYECLPEVVILLHPPFLSLLRRSDCTNFKSRSWALYSMSSLIAYRSRSIKRTAFLRDLLCCPVGYLTTGTILASRYDHASVVSARNLLMICVLCYAGDALCTFPPEEQLASLRAPA